MADNNKKEKIAAAKKKLKQFQRTRSASRTREPGDQPREIPERVKVSPEPDGADHHHHQQQQHHHNQRHQQHEERVARATSRPAVNASEIPSPVQVSHPEPVDSSQTTASTESLQQLSRQINGMLSDSSAFVNGDSTQQQQQHHVDTGVQELEERNRDLASLLEKHSQANQQLIIQNQQLRDHSKSLSDQLEAERGSFYEKHKKDVGSLKEQLQVHIQTIGILVAEKTELQSQVGQSQRIADQRIEEIEELSGRLKASRQRVGDLERTLSSSSQSSQQLEKAAQEHAKEMDRLKMDLFKSNTQNEEYKQQASELTEQIQAKRQEIQASAATVEDLQKRLEMAELYAQQLSSENESSAGSVEVLNSLQKERDSLLARLHQHEELTSKLQLERDQLRDQYQTYTDQLRHQTLELTQQVTVLTEEREHLLNRQHHLEGNVEELQKRLEDAHNLSPPPTPVPATPAPPAEPSIPTEFVEEMERLKMAERAFREAMEMQQRDNAQLGKLLQEREETILSLERSVEEMGEQAGDKAQLLESIQSDKTALSRALSQNKELKTQLAELQQGFVKMSNDNMELVTKLHTEQYSSSETATKLARQDDETAVLRQKLAVQEGEMNELRTRGQMVEKELYQQDQVTDRLRHYEAQAQLVDTLQNELTSAQDMMEALTTQNSELRTMLIKATEVKGQGDSPSDMANGDGDAGADNGQRAIIESLQATIKQLELERGQMYENLKEQRDLSDSMGIKIADLQEEMIRRGNDAADSGKISPREYNELKTAMEMIQQKYMHVMHDKAELTDKADQLEHLVLQLQGETDTIGEYISLYHHQRALLQQRETQKNDYIAQLGKDREQLQDKLAELQVLVMQLLGEKNMLHSYSTESGYSATETAVGPSHQDQPHHQHPHPHHHLNQQHRLANGLPNSYEQDWPDYTSSESDTESEVEPIVGGQKVPSTPDSELTPTSSPLGSIAGGDQEHNSHLFNGHPQSEDDNDKSDLYQHHHHQSSNHDHHHHEHHPHQQQQDHHQHHHHSRHRSDSRSSDQHQHHHHHGMKGGEGGMEGGKTAHKILSLLTELGHSHLVEQVPLIDRNFLPCKYCKGAVQIV